MTDIFKTLQDNIIKLAESEETDFLPLVKSVYGDTPEAVLKGALFASYIYKKGDKKQKKILLECDGELKAKGSRKHIKQFNQMFPVVSEKKSTTKIVQSTPEPQIVLTEKIYKANIENSVKTKELELRELHNEENALLQAQIDELNNRLADVPKAFEELQKINTELVARLEQMGSKVAEKKFQKAVDAFNKNEFAKADKILMEIEETEKLNKKNFGSIAHSRGNVAEQDVRWKDAAEHYARAVQLDPCFENLISAQKLALAIGDHDSALSFGRDAKKAAIKEYGKDTQEYATIINNLGAVYNGLKDYKSAERLHTEALEIRENIFGKKHPEVAMSLNNLGVMYQEKKQYREATYFLKRALNIRKESLGLKHPATAITLNNLGSSYRDLDEFKKAKPLLKQALKIRKEILGDNHPDIAKSFNGLSGLYFRQGQYKKAEPLARQAVEIIENAFGPDHPYTKLFKQNYEDIKKIIANT